MEEPEPELLKYPEPGLLFLTIAGVGAAPNLTGSETLKEPFFSFTISDYMFKYGLSFLPKHHQFQRLMPDICMVQFPFS